MVKKLKVNTRGLLKSIFSQRHFRDGLHFFRTSKILDKNTSFMYNTGQTPRSFLAAVLRRLHQKLKGHLKSFTQLFTSTRRSVMKTKNVSFSGFGRILAWLFALITLLFGLAACGGGGGSTTPVVTHPPAPTPVVGNLSILVSPTNGATGVVPTSNIVLNYASSTNSYASSNATLTCDGTSIALAQSTDQAAKKVTFAPASVFPYGKTCIAQGSSTASGLDGGASTTVNWSATFTIEQLICSKPGEQVSADGQTCAPVATAWWPPKNITPMGVKDLSSGLNQLPDGCLSFTAECFKSFVSAGKMTAVNTTAVMTGMPAPDNRTLVTLAYKTPSGKMQLTLFFADNGQAAVQDVVDFNTSDPFDWVMGNERGYIIKRSADGTCAQWKWNYNSTTGKGLFWDYEVTACPQ